LEVVAALTTAEALKRGLPLDIDIAVIDAFDAAQPFDRFAGVRLVAELRQSADPDLAVIVISAHAGNDYLRLRLQEARADFLYRAIDLRDPAALTAAITAPDPACALGAFTPGELARLGVRVGARPNTLLALIESMEWTDPFLTTSTQAALGVPRRHIMKLRELVGSLGGLEAAPHLRGGGPTDRGTLPTWREAREYVRRLTGLELRL
jgi:CheY-like chemotaxis protein